MAFKYQILDHGCDGEQYFPGCGVAFTEFEHVVTGIGDSAHEAGQDALEQFWQTVDRHTLTVAGGEALERELNDLSKVEDARTDNDEEDREMYADVNEWHHYVSIRWATTNDA